MATPLSGLRDCRRLTGEGALTTSPIFGRLSSPAPGPSGRAGNPQLKAGPGPPVAPGRAPAERSETGWGLRPGCPQTRNPEQQGGQAGGPREPGAAGTFRAPGWGGRREAAGPALALLPAAPPREPLGEPPSRRPPIQAPHSALPAQPLKPAGAGAAHRAPGTGLDGRERPRTASGKSRPQESGVLEGGRRRA